MKNKKVIIFVLILFILFGVLFIMYQINCKDKNEVQVIDYTNYLDNEIFYQNFADIFFGVKSNYKIKEEETKNRVYIKIIDNNNNPITEGKIKVYSYDKSFILEQQVNSNGEIAINNLENDTRYYFEQSQTREGLQKDNTLYTLETAYMDKTFYKILINADHELTDEEEEKCIDDYNLQEKSKNTANIIYSDEQKKEDNAFMVRDFSFIMLKEELEGLKLSFATNDPIKEDSKSLSKCTVRISNSHIINLEIEKFSNRI